MGRVRVGVNGFGRIREGPLAFRICFDRYNETELEVVHINEPAAIDSSAYLLKYDSVHGTWTANVEAKDDHILVTPANGAQHTVTYSSHLKPGEVPWETCGVELVLECSGKFLTRDALNPILERKVRKVVVSAPVKDANPVLNIVYGCNEHKYDPSSDAIVTAASCTTNCLAPVVRVIHEKLGIQHGCITTIHNVTKTQTIVDAPNTKKSDLRRARSGLVNLAPTSTGSATAIALIFPELKGKLNGLAVRVPLINSSITDCVFEVSRPTTVQEVNDMLKDASETYLKGILGYEVQPLVSTDFVNDARSSIIDSLSTQVIDGTMVKILAWYDSEYGYSCRMVDVGNLVAKQL